MGLLKRGVVSEETKEIRRVWRKKEGRGRIWMTRMKRMTKVSH